MIMKSPATEITVQAIVNAPIETVWNAWTEPRHITKWNQASDDWHCPHAEQDLREGGKYKATMAARDGSAQFDFEAVYTKLVHHRLIESKMTDGRMIAVSFVSQGNETVVVEKFDAETMNAPELQREGWQAILNNFKKYTESLT